ncbi:NAD(P)/FAD-dependent oxidoreductase [Marinimicrobium agarilyticum]|uniref:NAD(P)/FAD-dependent oxidoreductase n=1 Tax=Marinimicrobium agarilyticum TaxID=306546 RepID=UPI000412018F|nr:FAD-dependent oxidoreductase [Marinimicrobium agarilyticum]
MATIAVMGAGLGGMQAGYDMKKALGAAHRVVLINPSAHFQFTPSNPWVAVGWRKPDAVTVDIGPAVGAKGVEFIAAGVTHIDPKANRLTLSNDEKVDFDYLIITTGPKLAFDEIPGFGPDGFTQSVCTNPHAQSTFAAYEKFLENPGPIVVGAVQGASCFGPAYEFAFILDADLRKRKLRHKVPMTYVSSEPYIGHMGLGGVGDSKGLLESEFRQRDIRWITNAKVDEVTKEHVKVTEHNLKGEAEKTHEIASRFTMLLPAFKGVDAVAEVKELCNPRGFVVIDDYQRNPTYPHIYAAGVCVAIAPPEPTPIPTGVPKTGYMIESMVTAAVENIKADIEGKAPYAQATWNAVCLADMGDTGAAFVALPQIPPRNTTWAKKGKWVHLAKVAFEKYFLHKMRSGNTEPVYEKYVLKALGIERLKDQ